jgi:hypothetical protein
MQLDLLFAFVPNKCQYPSRYREVLAVATVVEEKESGKKRKKKKKNRGRGAPTMLSQRLFNKEL